MFRRRIPLRPLPLPPRPPLFRRRVPPPTPPLPPRALQALANAHNAMAEGRYAEAAAIFGDLSTEAVQRGMPIRAADLALQASRAHFAADNVEAAMDWARQALRLFARGGRIFRIPPLLAKMATALREKGYTEQAEQLEKEAAQILGEAGVSLDELSASQPKEKRHDALPARCAGCGAPLIPDEIEWHDVHTAECPYCGTLVKATSL